MTGRKWTAKEETKLKSLVEANYSLDELAAKMNKTPKAVMTKCQRLGLPLSTEGYINTCISIPRELPSVEEALKILAGALQASVKPGLSRLEVQRLQTVANISRTYKELLVDYMHYREVENKLEESEKQIAQLQETLKGLNERSPSLSSE